MLPGGANIKNVIMGASVIQLALGLWLFIALCAHASKGAFLDNSYGIGGRLGFAYFFYNLSYIAYWGYLLVIAMGNKYDIETWYMMKYVTGFFAFGNWIMTFVVIGAARQIAFTTVDVFRSDSFLAAAKASIAALIIGMIACIAFTYYVIVNKYSLLDAQDEPQQPSDLPQQQQPNEQQAFYQSATGGYQADSAQSYGNAATF